MTRDSQDIKRLKEAFDAATPAPDDAVSAFHMHAAMENFAAAQELNNFNRPKSRGLTAMGRLKGLFEKMTSNARLASATAVVLVATSVVIFSPIGRVFYEFDDRALNERRAIASLEPPLSAPEAPLALRAPPPSTVATNPPRDEFANAELTGFQRVSENPVSTFSVDVDTASYTIVRSYIERGALPPVDAVRIEEMLNYFSYDYQAPESGDAAPLRPSINLFETPWNEDTLLMHVGLQAPTPSADDREPLNLVFLVDTSGSMNEPDKLPLLIQSFRLMLDELRPGDEVSIVTYAGNAGVALSPTDVTERAEIEVALVSLNVAGSTNGIGGLQQAYDLADTMSAEDEITRIVLATDGDFNVGISDPDQLADYVAEQRDRGTYLSVLGFGSGNLQDDTMQALAQNGNGIAAYIDTLSEARRIMVDRIAGMLEPIANDVKLQIEFNPAIVAEYRLIGYETRMLAREDFRNDAVDAGDVGAGHSVTALYEIVPVGSPAVSTGPLRYAEQTNPPAPEGTHVGELGFLMIRWKEPGEDASQLLEVPISNEVLPTGEISPDSRFAAAIAGFGLLLRDDPRLGDWSFANATALVAASVTSSNSGMERREAEQLMHLAESLVSGAEDRPELRP